MQAIITKFIPATNFKGSRIKASCERGSITVSYPHELNQEQAHAFAADALVQKFVKEDAQRYGTERNPWTRPRICGWPNSRECCHVFQPFDGNSVLIEFANADDRDGFINYRERALKQDGTVSGLYAGIMCSAIKRSKI